MRQGTPPTWDLICECLVDGRPGLLLVEAKAHEQELGRQGKLIANGDGRYVSLRDLERSPTRMSAGTVRSLVNHGYIGRCIDEARDGLRRFLPELAISRDSNSQLSNRIASAWKVADCGMPAVLLYLGFTGDEGMRSEGTPLQDREHWRSLVRSHLGDIGAQGLVDGKIVLANGCPVRLCIGELPGRRQSSLGNQARARRAH